jgi:uncharacterized phage protein gp47/JayE
MIVMPSVVIDGRDQDLLRQELEARRPGYLPNWNPGAKDPGRVLEVIAARYAQAILQRLNQSPEKNKLAFLDMLGERLSPARAARAPVVFQLSNGAASGEAPAGTSVAAPPPPGSSQQMVFETESAVGITAGKIMQVFSLWPGRDEYIDHSADFLAGKTVSLFDPQALTTAPHHLYLAHSALLNLSGNVVLGVEFQFLHAAVDALNIAWEYWDGQVWREFAAQDPGCEIQTDDPNDATNGMTVSGVIKLKADCAKSDKTAVNGATGYWIRGRLTQSLPPDPEKLLPEVESIRISSLVNSSIVARLSGKAAQPLRKLNLVRKLDQPALELIVVQPVQFAMVGDQPRLTGTVMNEAQQPLSGATVTVSKPDPHGFAERTTGPTGANGQFSFAIDDIGSDQALIFEVAFYGVRAATKIIVPSNTAEVSLTLKLSALVLDKAFNDGTKLDTTKPFYPFGQQPQPGTVFYFSNKEIFTKPGARFRMYLPRTSAPSDELMKVDANGKLPIDVTALYPQVVWEYWDGRGWTELVNLSEQTPRADFGASEILDFAVPADLAPVAVNDDLDLWMRARLVSGGYGFVQNVKFNTTNQFTLLVTQPPILAGAALAYSWQFGPFHPETVLTFNDFRYEDRTYEAIWPGSFFQPYRRMEDVTPALYLGFDQKPPTADIGLFFDIVEQPSGSALASMVWEYWDGFAWSHVAVDDETRELSAPGILSFIAEDDSVALARFGTALHWLRGRLKEDGPPSQVTAAGIYPNAVWALQQRTFTDVDIGKASGQPDEVFSIAQIPIIPGERLEVLELSGPRTNVEWRLIALELFGGDNDRIRKLEGLLGKEVLAADILDGDLRLRRDKQKRVAEVWVRWYPQPNLFFSNATQRHYVIDRARGLVFFGDGVNGRTLPPDAAVNLRAFQSGGGSDGNVAARTITQLLGAVSGVQAVFNPRAAEGGSDGETLERFRLRAPASVRHAGRALTAGDYEAMVREASSAVAVVKALPGRNPSGRLLPGWVTILIIPESREARPYPTRGLRDEVLAYLAARAPAGVVAGGRLYVTGPTYCPIDVSATIVPLRDSEAGEVDARARVALEDFLHPLHGGPSHDGWDFGRGVHMSDVATVLESVEGLDHAEVIQLLANNEVRGDFIEVPPDQIVVAGSLRIKVKGAHQ